MTRQGWHSQHWCQPCYCELYFNFDLDCGDPWGSAGRVQVGKKYFGIDILSLMLGNFNFDIFDGVGTQLTAKSCYIQQTFYIQPSWWRASEREEATHQHNRNLRERSVNNRHSIKCYTWGPNIPHTPHRINSAKMAWCLHQPSIFADSIQQTRMWVY